MSKPNKLGRKRLIILICSFSALILIIAGIFYIYFKNGFNQLSQNPCLEDNEIASWSFSEWWVERLKYPETAPVIYIKDKNTNQEKFSFQIDNVRDSGYPLELHRCGVYVIKEFNWDREKYRALPGFSVELWRHQYNGKEEELLVFSEKDESGTYHLFYNDDFRIDSNEKYVALVRSYMGQQDFAIVIKDLESEEDVFELPLETITDKYSSLAGNLDLIEWNKDGQYFWGRTHYGAYTLGFFRIDTLNWKADILPAPEDVLGGDALNVKNGYITVHPGNVWLGFADATEEEKAKRREQGIGTELYIENLFTGKRYLVDKTDEPLWYFKPKWISDTELEYYMPSGERRVYSL